MNKKYNIIYADLLGITAIPKILMVNFGEWQTNTMM